MITTTIMATRPSRATPVREAQRGGSAALLSQIRQYPDVALRMKASEVTEFDEYLVQLAERMLILMSDAQGVGLAATQVGVLQRMFVFDSEGEGAHAVVNPRLVNVLRRQGERRGGLPLAPGCARPGRAVDEGDARRKDPAGEDVSWARGLTARVVQHGSTTSTAC